MKIGTFSKTETGFAGILQTLTLKANLSLVSVEASSEKAPDYRALAGEIEVGAGWSRTTKTGKNVVNFKIDTPEFAAPIYATLVASDNEKFDLYWSR